MRIIVPGELWLGLENVYNLTSKRDYSLRVTLTDFDGQTYFAVYNRFQVRYGIFNISMNMMTRS